MPSVAHKRGTRAQIDAAAAANGLRTGEIYLVTDEARLTVGTAPNAHQPLAREGEGGGSDPWSWSLLAADVAIATQSFAPVTGLAFAAVANRSYLVDLVGAVTSAASTTGLAMALDIPGGAVIGQMIHNTSASALGGTEQNADATTSGTTTGVRAAGANLPVTARFIVAIGATGGTVQLLARSEVAGSAITVKAGLTALGWRAL